METDTMLLSQLKDPQADQTNRATKDKFERAILLLDPYVHPQKDGTFTLDAAAQQLDIEPDVFTHLTSSLEHGNAQARLGRTQPQSGAISFLSGPGGPGPGNGGNGGPGGSPTPPPPRKTCAGQDVLLTYWWGFKLYVDECLTQSLEKLLALAIAETGAAAAIAAILGVTPAIPLVLISGILAADNQFLMYVDSLGASNGLIFNQTRLGPFWVWHQ